MRRKLPDEAAPASGLPQLTERDRWISWCTFDLARVCACDAEIAKQAHYEAVGRLTAQAAREHYGRESLTAGECTSFPVVDLTPADVGQVAIVAARRRAARDLLARMSTACDGVVRHADDLVRWVVAQGSILERLGAAGFLRFDPPGPPPRPASPRGDRLARDPSEAENAFDARAVAAGA